MVQMSTIGKDQAAGWMEKPVRLIKDMTFRRFVVRTHLVRPGERLDKTLMPYLAGLVEENDIVIVGEKIVAIAEGRAVLVKSITPRPLARYLSERVRPLGYGVGLRRPETMEMAIREVGTARILAAAVAGALDRIFRRTGDFYRIAGRQVTAIDGPGPTTIPPYNRYIVLAPKNPKPVIEGLAHKLGCQVAVVDVNDVGSEVLAASPGLDWGLVQELMRDNPMGQGAQGTPLAVLRPILSGPSMTTWSTLETKEFGGGWITPFGGEGDSDLRLSP